MKKEFKSVKGMPDILPVDTPAWQFLESNIEDLMQAYAYQQIRLPIVEKTSLFKRSIGEVTDIVEKEMYTFVDRDKESTSLTLRPEGTASCVRAVLEHALARNSQVQRLWYLGPMFRRERPQKGRYRQFWQLGVETFSLDGHDVEIEHLLMMQDLWSRLGISDFVKLEINSLGTKETRQRYIEKLTGYYNDNFDKLDESSKDRLSKNPLRLLDSKSQAMNEVNAGAPKLIDSFTDSEKSEFDKVTSTLDAMGVKYEINTKLVRGLDYYQGLVYEWTTEQLGAQGTICAGGRYDGLIEQLGGDSNYAVGFAMGLERVLALIELANTDLQVADKAYIACISAEASSFDLHTAYSTLRKLCPSISFWVQWGRSNMKNSIKKAINSGAKWALILGDDELDNNAITIKYLQEDLPQVTASVSDIREHLK